MVIQALFTPPTTLLIKSAIGTSMNDCADKATAC